MAAVLGANFYAKLIYFYINNNRIAKVVSGDSPDRLKACKKQQPQPGTDYLALRSE